MTIAQPHERSDVDPLTRDAEAEEAIAFLRALVAAQPAGEAAVQALISYKMSEAGAVVENRPFDPAGVPVIGEFAMARAQQAGERVNVIGRLPGAASRRSLLMFAHPDSEPVAGTDTWVHDPFSGTIVGGRLYGWGVADDLAGIAAGALAISRAARAGVTLGDVIMISAPSKRHARGVAAAMHQGVIADAALYLHPAESGAGLNEIKAFASGQLEFRITVNGKFPPTNEPSHTAFAHLAVNPVDKAMVIHGALRALDAARDARTHHPALQKEVGRSTNLMVSNLLCGEDRKFGRLNQTCTLAGALSFPPGETLDEVKGEVEAAIAAACAADPHLTEHPATIEWLSGVTGAECPPDHPLYLTAARAVSAQTGGQPHVNPMHTSSDIRNPIVQKAIPTVGLGGLCGDLTQNGRHDEWIDVDDYLRTIAATTAIILDWCGHPRSP
jgi:acetylornithine deacetylase